MIDIVRDALERAIANFENYSKQCEQLPNEIADAYAECVLAHSAHKKQERRMAELETRPFATYPEVRQELMSLAETIRPTSDIEELEQTVFVLADQVKAMLQGEAAELASEEDD
jgi:hypothetical protein